MSTASAAAAGLMVFGCASKVNSEPPSATGGSKVDAGQTASRSGSSGSSGLGAGGKSGAGATASGIGGGIGGGSSGGGSSGGGSAGSATYELVPCRPASLFTGCVKECGDPARRVPEAARCVDGFYACPKPLIVAASCPGDAWPDGSYAGCGPWVENYDCTCPAVCEDRLWTCYVDCLRP